MNPDAALDFGEVQRALTLFAQGIAGRNVRLQPLPHVGAAARLPSIDAAGVTIRLPTRIDRFAHREHNRGAYRLAVLHQIGHLEFGSFDLGPRLEHGFAVARRPVLLRRLFITLEGLRVDAALLRCYPGARQDMQRVFADALTRRPPLAALRPATALVEALVQLSLGVQRAALLRDRPDSVLSVALDLAASLRQASATVGDSARAAMRICTSLEASSKLPRPRAAGTPAVPEADPPGPGDAPAAEAGAEGQAGEGESAMLEFRAGLLPDRLPGQAARIPVGRATQGCAARRDSDAEDAAPATPPAAAPVAVQVPLAVRGRQGDDEASIHYVDEWDCHQERYLSTWCRVVEQRLRGDDHGFIDGVRRRHVELAGQVKRQFALLRPELWHRVHRTDDGDELDLDAVIQARVDRRTGRTGDERAYVRRDRALRDVAAALLLDMSASTDHPVRDEAAASPETPPTLGSLEAGHETVDYLYGRYDPGHLATTAPTPPKRRVIDVAKDALALMCDALYRLGDSHAVYGFSGAGRENVEFRVAKDFDEAPGVRTWAALSAMQPRGGTRMGAAIRHATDKLARRVARVKVLIVVSDGYPQDQDYGPDPRDEEYGLQDTARALQQAERAGVAAFCLTIDPAGHDYLRRMCAAQRYLVIDNVRQLPKALSQVYGSLTRAG